MTGLVLLALCFGAVAGAVYRSAWMVRRRGPSAEFWFAQVPFEDGTGSKDRPVLVLGYDGSLVKALALTSQNQSTRSGYVKVDTSSWGYAGRRASWLRLDRVVTLPASAMRRRLGQAGPALWARVVARHALLLLRYR